MVWDYAENIFQLLADLIALVMCLFYFISNRRREWLYGLLFFLCGLLSCYYWTTYLIIMRSWPTVSDLIAYSGWDLAYVFLLILVLHMKTPEERRYFHPLYLIALPLDAALLAVFLFSPPSPNAAQLTTSIHESHLLNNIYLIAVCNLIGIYSLQSLCWYWKKRKEGMRKPWVALAALLMVLFGFAMLVFSNIFGPVSDLYYPFSWLSSLSYLFLVWAISRSVPHMQRGPLTSFERRTQNTMKAASLGVVIAFSVGGVLLGVWIRDMLTQHISSSSAASAYGIIPIVLFIISLILITFVISMILVVYFSQRAAQNGRLREAREVAERSNAAKSEFLAAMSHEIRTPINAVLGMNEVVLRESGQACDRLPESTEEIREIFGDIRGYAVIINTAGRNLLSIINDILDVSRIEAGKMEIREDSYSLSSVLNDVCSLVSIRAKARDLDFRVNVEERLPDNLYGDALRVRQVMMNILNNAVKYTERGSVTLSVCSDAGAVFEDGQTMNLIFSVKDTGIGIRPEDQDKLYNKFERLGLTESDGVEGSGLGLTITKDLLDMMGADIRVENEYGVGSLFTVTIPQKIVSAKPIGNFREGYDSTAAKADIPPEIFRAPEARILLVDDTHMNLTVAEGLLKRTAMQIDKALSGEEALRLTLGNSYDLILLDQRMPVMDGIETMRCIRAQEGGANRQTPIICLTADAAASAKERYLSEGYTDYISKPIDSRELREKILACLPPEKVILLDEKEDGNRAETDVSKGTEDFFAGIRTEDVDVAQGLMYCQQDPNLYRSLLEEFESEAPGRMERMEQSFASCSWKDYAILVHSLKSISGTIGAVRLSSAAAAMEAAAKREDTEALRTGHAPLMAVYGQTVEALRGFWTDAAPSSPGEDSVIEFMPEG